MKKGEGGPQYPNNQKWNMRTRFRVFRVQIRKTKQQNDNTCTQEDGRGALQKFIYGIQEEEALILRWKKGPYVNNTKLNPVSISNWPNKGTLMFQGPEASTD